MSNFDPVIAGAIAYAHQEDQEFAFSDAVFDELTQLKSEMIDGQHKEESHSAVNKILAQEESEDLVHDIYLFLLGEKDLNSSYPAAQRLAEEIATDAAKARLKGRTE